MTDQRYTISIDTGGTFTDLVLSDREQVLGLYKASTTYPDLFPGVSAAVELAAADQSLTARMLLERTAVFVYSTTHSTNAIIRGTIAKTALITTRGHRDVLLYREGGKDQVHNWALPFPEPYVPRSRTFEVTERVLADGSIAVPLDEAEVQRTLERLAALDVEAIGVSLLWSSQQPAHELCIGALIEDLLPGVEYSLSHRVNRVVREYRRASSTVIDASLKPLMREHLQALDAQLRSAGFNGEPLMVTHVSGGVMHLDQMVERPIETVDSGPALAPIAGMVLDAAEPGLAHDDVLVVDTGGTSFDVSLIIDGQVAYTREKWLGPQWYGFMTGLPAVDTRSVGAGGGSIAYIDPGGLLRVGPDSAGSDPGPAAYGRGGTDPTVTDAAVVLGYIDPDQFLGGRMPLDAERARHAIADKLATPLGLSPEDCAEAVLVIASEEMRGLINDMTVAQGRDARRCLMIAGGGAAGLNIVRIAKEAEIGQVVIPKLAAGLSALGGQYSDIMASFSRGHYTRSSAFDIEGVNAVLEGLDRDIDAFLDDVHHAGSRQRRFVCEARYDQQLWEIDVDLGELDRFGDDADVAELKRAFDVSHGRLFAMSQAESPIEILTWRGEGRVVRAKPALASAPAESATALVLAASTTRDVYFEGHHVSTRVFSGVELPAGAVIAGPAIIEEPTTTIVLNAGSSATVKPSHYLIDVT